MSLPEEQGAETLMQQAYDQLTEGRLEEAVETFSAALAVEPHAIRALYGRGLAYRQLKQWPSAAEDFDAARRLDPGNANCWIELGLSLAMADKIYPAMEVFETLLAQQPTCARGHLELGLLHFRLGAIPKGRQCLQQALACRPTLTERRQIESFLREQDKLDRKRYYRPDFEALHRQESSGGLWGDFQLRFKLQRGGPKHSPGTIGRDLVIWLGSFLAIASILYAYCRVPIGPLMLAGGATLVVTVVRSIRARQGGRPRL